MPAFIADQSCPDIVLNPVRIKALEALFRQFEANLNSSIGVTDPHESRAAVLSFVIRFDNRGFRVHKLQDLLDLYLEAKVVERVVFVVETGLAIASQRSNGAFIELRVDGGQPNASQIVVASDVQADVTQIFAALKDHLTKYQHRRGWIRKDWMLLVAQLCGVVLGFLVSLWAATKLAPLLTIENALLFSFLFTLMLFSNLWTFAANRILRLLHWLAPTATFHRDDKPALHWIWQAIIGAAALAVIGYVVGKVGEFLGGFIASLVNQTLK